MTFARLVEGLMPHLIVVPILLPMVTAAVMLLLTSVLGLGGVLYASARWHKAGVHFHPLFQLQLMGCTARFSRPTCSTCSCSSRSC